MKKLIISILLLSPLFLFAQARVLNGQYNDGQSFGKLIPDTVRTLVAAFPLSIASGGTSLVDTIKSSGGSGTPGGGDTYIQYDSSGYFSGNSGLTYDRTGQNLFVSQALQAGRIYGDTLFGQNGVTGDITLIPTNTGATGRVLFRSSGAFDVANSRLGIGTLSPAYDVDIVHSINGASRAAITNSNSGTSAQVLFQASNGTASFQAGVLGSAYTPTRTNELANGVYFQAGTASEVVFRNTNSGSWLWVTNAGSDNERWRIDFSTGNFSNTQAAGVAYIDLKAGTSSAAPLLLREGVAPTSPVAGSIWTESTNHRLMFRQNSTSVELIGTSSVNTVSPTSPNRTLTVVIGGTTLYIPAKTTND